MNKCKKVKRTKSLYTQVNNIAVSNIQQCQVRAKNFQKVLCFVSNDCTTYMVPNVHPYTPRTKVTLK